MRKYILLVTAIMVLCMFFPSCKTAEFVWNPVGVWSVTIVGDWGETWTETLTFTGSETSGMVSGWEYLNPALTPGTWTKTGFSITMNLNFNNGAYTNNLTFNGTSSEASPNSMSGTGSWVEYYNGSYNDTFGMTFNGTKTTNPQ